MSEQINKKKVIATQSEMKDSLIMGKKSLSLFNQRSALHLELFLMNETFLLIKVKFIDRLNINSNSSNKQTYISMPCNFYV